MISNPLKNVSAETWQLLFAGIGLSLLLTSLFGIPLAVAGVFCGSLAVVATDYYSDHETIHDAIWNGVKVFVGGCLVWASVLAYHLRG